MLDIVQDVADVEYLPKLAPFLLNLRLGVHDQVGGLVLGYFVVGMIVLVHLLIQLLFFYLKAVEASNVEVFCLVIVAVV